MEDDLQPRYGAIHTMLFFICHFIVEKPTLGYWRGEITLPIMFLMIFTRDFNWKHG